MLISESNIQRELLEYGYSSTSNNAARVFSNVVDKIFFGFGETIQNGLISEAKKQEIPNDFKFPYYSMVENSILDFMGELPGKKILTQINEELTKQTAIDGSIETILNEISRREILEKIDKFSGHEHVLYLWREEETRDNVISQFFKGTKGPKVLVSSKKSSNPDIKNTLYSEIFEDKGKAVKKNGEAILKAKNENSNSEPSRLAGTDGTQWIDQNMRKELLEQEFQGDQFISQNLISVICAYDIKKITDKGLLKKLADCHQFILLDNPFVIYERGN